MLARYWRLIGIGPIGTTLTLTEIAVYSGATRVEGSATITSTIVPSSGALPGPVSFDKAHAAGFAIEFDFGTDTDITGFGLRSPTEATFPRSATFQYLLAGTWVTTYHDLNLQWVSSATLTQYVGDPYWKDVALMLKFDGTNGATTTVDSSPRPKPITLSSGGTLSTAESQFGGSSLLCASGTQRAECFIPSHAQREFIWSPTSDHTIDFFYRPTALPGVQSTLIGWTDNSFGWAIRFNTNGTVSVHYTFGGAMATSSVALTLNVFNHIEMVKRGSNWQVFVNGVGGTVGTYTLGSTFTMVSFQVGTYSGPSFSSSTYGHFDHVRCTNIARHTADFTPPAVDDAAYTLSAVKGDTAATPKRHRLDRGNRRILATVKKLPGNVPVRRLVQLIEQRSGNVIDETWSDPVTGAYVFNDLSPNYSYTTQSFDHTGELPPAIADNVPTEIMP